MALDRFKQLYGWGEGTLGCLGFGDARKKMMPIIIPFFEGKQIIDVACGESFTVVIAEVVGDPMQKASRTIEDIAFSSPAVNRNKSSMTVRGENPNETRIKSNRKPLCGGNDISINVRDKVMSVISKNRNRALTQMEGYDVAFDFESVHGGNSERKLRMNALQDARSMDDYTSQASIHEGAVMLPQINTAARN